MTAPTGTAVSHRHERRYRRFKLRYPVQLLYHSGNVAGDVAAVSRNISRGGLLLESPEMVPLSSTISFVISLSGRKLRPVRLTGEGKVVRVEPSAGKMEFMIAVECTNPITQIAPYLHFRQD